jgi:hypothetical protein
MSTYYKYAEQNANSQVNWADVSKNVSDMLNAEVEIREKKKTAYQEAFQKTLQENANSPQGKWQDGNRFTNDAAHDIMQQSLLNYRLFTSGQMNERDYTFSRQNLQNGTNTLFDLQRLYQANYDDRMQGLLTNKYQAMTGAEMEQVEGFKDFSTSKAIIDPYTGIVSIGKMVKNPTTGVLELSKDVVPVNVLKGKINTPIPAWDADGSINDIVSKMGKNEEFLYQAAGTMRAGTITKLLGLGALEGEYAKKDKDGKPLYPQFKDTIDTINKGINDAISSAFSNPYNISSVLTQNLGGKYNQDSFTYDKNVAASDKGKILLKIDATTGLSTLDKESPNFKAQEQEARDWVKGQMLSKMDAKRELTTTGTTPFAPRETEGEREAREGRKTAVADAQTIGALWGGSPAAIQKAVTRFRDMNPNILDVTRGRSGVSVTLVGPDGINQTRDISFYAPDGRTVLTQEEFIQSAAPLLAGNTNISDAISRGGYVKGAKFNPSSEASAKTKTQARTGTGLPPAPMTNKYLLGGSAPAGGGVGSKYNTQK